MKYIYTGPSWAAQSYDDVNGPFFKSTNLSREWGIECLDLSKPGSSVLDRAEAIKESGVSLPIVWVYNEPLLDITTATGLTLNEFVVNDNWKNIREECNQYCLGQIDALGLPVLLIGGHSDVLNCDHSNITVVCPSWQTWLAEQSGMAVNGNNITVDPEDGGNYNIDHCWGAEVVHKFLHENQQINPNAKLLDSLWDIYYFWAELQKRNWFWEVHPNMRGNVEFAKFLKPAVNNFLSII